MENSNAPAGKYPVVGITLAAAAGICLADFQWWTWHTSLILVLVGLALWICVRRTTPLLIVVLFSFCLIHSLQFDGNTGRILSRQLGSGEIAVSGTAVVDSAAVESSSANGRARASFQVKSAELTTEEGGKIGPVSLLVRWPASGPKIGDRISFEGNLFNLEPPRNPGEFDYAAWLARKQIFSAVSVSSVRNTRIIEVGSTWNMRRWAISMRERLASIITRDLEDAPIEAGVISAMMLGTSDDTAESTKELFLKTGTLHLFSVSGLHVSMLAAITLFVLLLVRVPRRTALFLTIPAVFAYALVTGWSASSVRAALMTAAFVVATLLDRPSLSINTLAVACLLILLADTNQLFATSFQLSFSVVAAIVLFCGPITRWLQEMVRPDPFIPRKLLTSFQKSRWHFAGKFSASLGLTIAAWLGSLPLSAYYFNLLSPVALLANLVIIPISFVVLALSVLSILVSFPGSWLTVIFNNANWGAVKILLCGLEIFAAIPGGSLFVGPHWWQRSTEQCLTVFDLGSGGAAILETGSGCWLVDCGSESHYRRVVRRYLQKRGINRVDGIFLTHGDGSHVGGITQFRVDFPQAKIYLPEAGKDSIVFRRLIESEAVHWIAADASMSLDHQANIRVLWPPPTVDGGRADDHCLILKLTLADQTILLTGDSGLTTEMDLMLAQRGNSLRADWLVMGSNRDDPGGSKSFLQRVGAKSVLKTAAKFPASEQIPRLWTMMCQKMEQGVIRFDKSGAVQVGIQKDEVRVKTFAGAGNNFTIANAATKQP